MRKEEARCLHGGREREEKGDAGARHIPRTISYKNKFRAKLRTEKWTRPPSNRVCIKDPVSWHEAPRGRSQGKDRKWGL